MAVPDESIIYVITNHQTKNDSVLSVSSNDPNSLEMAPSNPIGTRQQWFVRLYNDEPFYQLHNVATGDARAVDVVNEGEADNSTALTLADTGSYVGQRWKFEEVDGAWHLWNDWTGDAKYMEVDGENGVPFLADKDGSADTQEWIFIPADAFSNRQTDATTDSGPGSKDSSTSDASQSSSGGGMSTGAKAGIGAGVGVLALGLLAAFIFFWRRRKGGSSGPTYIPEGSRRLESASPEYTSVSVGPTGKSYDAPAPKGLGYGQYEAPSDGRPSPMTPSMSPMVELPAPHQKEVHELQ